MPRLQIELTSARPDGSWTWRVAGARQPKGTLAGELLPAGAKVGDVLRVDAEVELEGTTITAVLPDPAKRQERPKLEVLGTPKPFEGVTTSLVPKGGRPRRSGWDGAPSDRAGRDRDRDRGGRQGAGPGRRREPGADQPRADREGGEERPRRAGAPAGPRPPVRSGRPDERPRREGQGGARPGGRPDGSDHRSRSARPGRASAPQEQSGAPKPKRLSPANTHRAAMLVSLAPEERPIGEQLLHGGIPAVRRALQEQNSQLAAEGKPEIKTDAILALAEALLPRMKTAEWRDRAEAAAAIVDEIGLRDLRSVVAGADAARDDETRLLAKTLREALDHRETKEREEWEGEIGRCLDEGRLVRALRVAARPPDPRNRFPSELAARLSDAAGSALAPDVQPERWLTVLEAVVESPVRRTVKPAGLPAEPGTELLAAARQASGRVPALAAMLGIDIPPPPRPLRPRPPRGPTRPGPPRAPDQAPPVAKTEPTDPEPAAPQPGEPVEPSAPPPAAADSESGSRS